MAGILLICFGVVVSDAASLVQWKERADVIPASLDALIQTTTLADVGLCCLALGCVMSILIYQRDRS